MKRAVLIVTVSSFVLLFLLPIAASRTAFGALLTWLPFGWFVFLKRNLPLISTNWSLIGMVLLCSAILLLLGHWFLRALFNQIQINQSAGQNVRWRFRWGLSIYAGIWLLFVIVFGASGLFRQTTWLLNEERPWYKERLNSYRELRAADFTVHECMLDTDEDLEKTRAAILSEKTHRQKPFFEQFEVLLYANENNKVEAYVLIPRNDRLLRQGRFAVVSLLDRSDFDRPISDLRRTIAQLDARYPKKR